MEDRPCLLRRSRRHTPMVLVMSCLAIWSVVFPAIRAEAGSLVVPAWSFARGNVVIHADPDEYADAGAVVVGGVEKPWGWSVEYDIEVPVAGTYLLQICYAAAEARPVEVFVDNVRLTKCCADVTFSPETDQATWSSSGARWECVRLNGQKSLELSLTKGEHTVMLTRRAGPLPHLVALRLDTSEEFPEDWMQPEYTVRHIESIPAEYRASLEKLSGVGEAVLRIPVEDTTKPEVAGSFTIPAWTFDRGNVRIDASPDEYADAGPLVRSESRDTTESVVEYDIDFPVDADYLLYVSYAADKAHPVDVFLDGRKLGKCCTGVTYGSRPFEHPIRFTSNSSGAVRKWEGICRAGRVLAIPVTKGKHTLRFSRNGPLPHLVSLRLDSRTAFPEDWEEPVRKVRDIESVPAPQRAAFLPPDAVNIGALRLALRDMVANFGSRYPDGKQYLKQLAELEARQVAAERGTDEDRQKVEEQLSTLRRRAMLAHPELKFDHLLFLKRSREGYGHTYRDQYANTMGGNLCVLSPVSADGKVTPLIPELDGGLFDRFDLSFDAKKLVFAYKKLDEPFRIYEIDIDPEAGRMVPGSLRQLTFGIENEAEIVRTNDWEGRCKSGGFDDMDPCYLPDGRIIFVSTRSMRNVLCNPSTVTTLYIMDADGANVRCLSAGPINETAPSVLDDGRVIYTRWEYVDKGLGNGQSLWVIRPDGSGSDHVYKNNTVRPGGMSCARSIPGSRRIVTVGGAHHTTAVGPVILVDPTRSRRGTDAMTSLNPELGYSSMYPPIYKFGFFTDPFPFSEKFFVVSHVFGRGYAEKTTQEYGLYVLDAWGNRAELYRDPEISSYQPIPLRPRRRPAKIAPITGNATLATVSSGREAIGRERAVEQTGSLFIQDIYQGMTGIEQGRVKYVRVMGALKWPWDVFGLQHVGADVHRKKVYGVVKVHEDGSAFFNVPADKNLFFQALDEDYMALQHMPTFVNLMPGEQRSCIGCHEDRRKTPETTGPLPLALRRPAESLMPQPGDTGPRMVHYDADVQPTLDKHCVRCHSGKNAKGRVDLTGMPTVSYNRSYERIVYGGLVSYADCRYGSANFRATPPLTRGSHRSLLTARIRNAPCNATLTREEFVRIATWTDANVPYYGTYRGKRDLEDKDDPDFRPFPLVGK